jgi:hypothetical protein
MDPTDPASPVVDVCKQLQVPIAASGLGEGSYRNTTCDPDTDALRAQYGLEGPGDPLGCLCRFDVTETGGPSGEYQVSGNIITHFTGSNFPQRATYCYQGDHLQLTGTDGSYLFDQKGVRTFDLLRACKANADCVSNNCNVNPANGQGTCQ